MAFGCLFDALRVLLVLLGMLCGAIVGAEAWLGPDHRAEATLSTAPAVAYAVTVSGPSPDVRIVCWEHNRAYHVDRLRADATLPAWPLALGTIGLCLLVMGLDRYDLRRRQPPAV